MDKEKLENEAKEFDYAILDLERIKKERQVQMLEDEKRRLEDTIELDLKGNKNE